MADKSSTSSVNINDATKSVLTGSNKNLGETNKIVDNTKKKFGELGDEGKKIPQDISDGIFEFIGKPAGAIGKLAENLVTSFKKALGIHSPSRVFKKMGGHVVEGLVKGLDVDNMKSLGMNAFKDFAGGAFESIDMVKGFLSGNMSGMNIGGGAGGWRPMIMAAAAQMGEAITPAQVNGIIAQIQRESGGNQSIIQNSAVNDINMRNGNPARGLLQYIPQTFNAYKVPGFGNIFDGYHQLLAFFNNKNWRNDLPYGRRGWGPRGARKYARGGLITSPHLGLVGEAGREYIIPVQNNKDRGLKLWEEAGRELGVNMFAKGGAVGNIS